MDITVIPTPRYDLVGNGREWAAVRNALDARVTSPAFAGLTDREKKNVTDILQGLTQLALGDA